MFGNKYKEQVLAYEKEVVFPLLTTKERTANYNRYKILIRQRIKQAFEGLSDPTISSELNEHVLKSYIYMYVGNVYDIFSDMYPNKILNYKTELEIVQILFSVFNDELFAESTIEEMLSAAVATLRIIL